MKIKNGLAKIGIEVSPEAKWHVHLKPRFFLILGSIFLLILISLLGVAKYSESPRFCNSCHIMEPYYNAWKTSKHNKVACIECHYPPGTPQTILWKKFQALSQVVKYVTRTYSSKPFAEVEDSSCLRSGCHSTRLLEGRVLSKRGIKFDHTAHITQTRRDRQLRCTSCHSQIVVGRHVEVTYDTCYLCHFKGQGHGRDFEPIGGCLGCHELPQQDFKVGNMTYNHKDFVTKQGIACQDCHLDVVRGEGNVTQDRCFTCHNQPEKLARFKEGAFLHENHVTKHNVACFHCHQEIEHGFAEPEKPTPEKAGVPAGHVPTLMFDCSYCHENKHAGQLEMYTGKVAPLGLPEIASPMFLANVDCIGCHYQEKSAINDVEFLGRTFAASKQACVKCHGPEFKGILDETKNELKETMDKLNQKMEALQSLPEAELKQAKRWLHFVRDAKGEHNIYLASAALRRVDQALSEAGAKLNLALPDLSGLPLLSGSYCATMCHAQLNVKVPPETVKAFGTLTMPHAAHTAMFGCVHCHEIGAHKKVPLKKNVKKEVCSSCHNF